MIPPLPGYSHEDLFLAKSHLRLLKQKMLDKSHVASARGGHLKKAPSLSHLKIGGRSEAKPVGKTPRVPGPPPPSSFGTQLVESSKTRASSASHHTKLRLNGIESAVAAGSHFVVDTEAN